jgi:very-short-patch-repair endonuclease
MTEKQMFDKHPKALFWSERNEKKPSDVALNSHKKFWFNCDCSHQFESTLLNINLGNNWCPYCSNHVMKLCSADYCKMCFNNSFASHEKAKYWSDENELTPRQVFKATDKKFYFNCECGHKIIMSLKKISRCDHWCSYCAHQKLCEDESCLMCLDNSFASVEQSSNLHDKSINPRTLFKSTNKKFKFDCDNCNGVFETILSDITKGIWCPYCVNKTEKILYDKLIFTYPALKRQYKVKWCKNKNYLPFDFVIEKEKIIIELDGKQHFEQVGKWVSPEENRKNDLYNMKCANENSFSVIRILQKDVYKNKYHWLNGLISNIEKISNENRVQNIYMCKNNEYKNFDLIE